MEKKNDKKLTRKENSLQVIKFIIFSVSAGVIQTISFTVINELTTWKYTPCYLIALTLSVLWNFTLNREFTFKSANNIPVAMAKVAAFYCVFTPASTWLEHWLTGVQQWNEYLVTGINMVLNFVLEFLYDRFVVFCKSIDTREAKK